MRNITMKWIIQALPVLAMLVGSTQPTWAADQITQISSGIDNVAVINTSKERGPILERVDVDVALDIEGLVLDHAVLMRMDPRRIQSASIFLSTGTPGRTGDHAYVQFYADDENTIPTGCHDIDNQQSCSGTCPCQ